MRLISTLFLLVLLIPLATAFPVYEPFAGSQFKYSNGSLIRTGSLQVEVFDASTGTGYVYAHNFTNRIINGTFAAVLGLDANELELVQGKNYYYDIRINNVDQDFQDNTGASLERLPFTASRGNATGFANCGVNAIAAFNLTTGNYTCVSVGAAAVVENLTNVNASVVALSQTAKNISSINATLFSFVGVSCAGYEKLLGFFSNGLEYCVPDDNITAFNLSLQTSLSGLTANFSALNASIQGISIDTTNTTIVADLFQIGSVALFNSSGAKSVMIGSLVTPWETLVVASNDDGDFDVQTSSKGNSSSIHIRRSHGSITNPEAPNQSTQSSTGSLENEVWDGNSWVDVWQVTGSILGIVTTSTMPTEVKWTSVINSTQISTDRMKFDGLGRIGLNHNAPVYSVHVNGTLAADTLIGNIDCKNITNTTSNLCAITQATGTVTSITGGTGINNDVITTNGTLHINTTFLDSRYLNGLLRLYFYNTTDAQFTAFTKMNTTVPPNRIKVQFASLAAGEHSLANRTYVTNLTSLSMGLYRQHTTANLSAGSRTVQFHSIITLRNATDGTERIIGTSVLDNVLVSGFSEIDFVGTIPNDVIISPNEYLVMRLNATVGSTGSAPTFELILGGDTGASIEIGTTAPVAVETDPFYSADSGTLNSNILTLNTTLTTILTGKGLNMSGTLNASRVEAFNLYVYNYTCFNGTSGCAGGRMIEYVNSSGCIIRVTASGGTDNWC